MSKSTKTIAPSALSERVTALRKLAKLSQKEMAAKLGILQQSYYSIEHHADHANLHSLQKIAEAHEVPMFFLFMQDLSVTQANIKFAKELGKNQRLIRENLERHTLKQSHLGDEIRGLNERMTDEMEAIAKKYNRMDSMDKS